MGFRVTQTQTTSLFVDQMFKLREALEQSRQEVSSGLRVANPSDDPPRAATIAQFQAVSERLKRQKQRIASVTGLLETQESVLDETQNLMIRAKEIAEQGANSTVTSDARKAMAQEVFQLRDTLASLANTKFQGVYIFGGEADSTAPFTASTYADPAAATDPAHTRWVFSNATGADQTRQVPISDSDAVQVASNGDTIFSDAISSVERLGRALAGYRTDPEDASARPVGTGVAFNLPAESAEQTAAVLQSLSLIENARVNGVVAERTSIGSRLNRVDLAGNLIDAVSNNIDKSRSAIQDVDTVEAASNFANLQISLQGLLASGAQINQLSLLNYL